MCQNCVKVLPEVLKSLEKASKTGTKMLEAINEKKDKIEERIGGREKKTDKIMNKLNETEVTNSYKSSYTQAASKNVVTKQQVSKK